MPSTDVLKRSPLDRIHREQGARMMPFAGWEMPVHYTGIITEHQAVRTAAGLFDVSHMGELFIAGQGALETVQSLITNDAGALEIGQARYTAMCNGKGGIIDDLIVSRIAQQKFLLVVNAGNTKKDYRWIQGHKKKNTLVFNFSDSMALVALQGPLSQQILAQLVQDGAFSALRYYHFFRGNIGGISALIFRTGYTGEDGFELCCDSADAPTLWATILEAGRPHGMLPCGLGARNTLRLEAGMMLHGNDIDAEHTPLEARLNWVVKFEKPKTFVGKRALLAQKKRGISRTLAGFEMIGRGIAREHYPIAGSDGTIIGTVTSGSPSPTLGKNIGMGYVPVSSAAPGTEIAVLIRGETVPARVVPLPFYKRKKT